MTGQMTIGTMSPGEVLVKEPFRRTLPAETLTNYGQNFATGGYLAANLLLGNSGRVLDA